MRYILPMTPKIPKLKNKALADVTLVSVDTRSRRNMFRVDVGHFQAGTVQKFSENRHTKTPWQAFRGIGASDRYVTSFFEDEGGLDAAVACVLDRRLS